MPNRLRPTPWLTEHYSCQDCGATAHDNPNASVYGEEGDN
jgi:hypothetical protein